MVCDQTFIFSGIAPQEADSADFKVTCEGHYTLDVTFESGRQLHAETGYITGGMSSDDRLLVSSDAVRIVAADTKI